MSEEDPVFVITDLLVTSCMQSSLRRKGSVVVEGEKLDLVNW